MPVMGMEAHFLGALEHALERLARAHGMRRAVGVDELAEHKGHVVVPGHVARVARSSRASASGKPCCQPVTVVLS
jgi:hypothetical protein